MSSISTATHEELATHNPHYQQLLLQLDTAKRERDIQKCVQKRAAFFCILPLIRTIHRTYVDNLLAQVGDLVRKGNIIIDRSDTITVPPVSTPGLDHSLTWTHPMEQDKIPNIQYYSLDQWQKRLRKDKPKRGNHPDWENVGQKYIENLDGKEVDGHTAARARNVSTAAFVQLKIAGYAAKNYDSLPYAARSYLYTVVIAAVPQLAYCNDGAWKADLLMQERYREWAGRNGFKATNEANASKRMRSEDAEDLISESVKKPRASTAFLNNTPFEYKEPVQVRRLSYTIASVTQENFRTMTLVLFKSRTMVMCRHARALCVIRCLGIENCSPISSEKNDAQHAVACIDRGPSWHDSRCFDLRMWCAYHP
jgi:hypothetical protein